MSAKTQTTAAEGEISTVLHLEVTHYRLQIAFHADIHCRINRCIQREESDYLHSKSTEIHLNRVILT